jgi:hypothetical protein
MSLNLERVWNRVKRNKLIPRGACLSDYRFISISKNYSLTTQQAVTNQPVDFPAGSIILSLGAWAAFAAQAASAVRGDLSMVRAQITYPSADGSLVTVLVNLAALLGLRNERQWPEKEILIPVNGTLNHSFTNLTTSTIDLDLVYNALVYKAASA